MACHEASFPGLACSTVQFSFVHIEQHVLKGDALFFQSLFGDVLISKGFVVGVVEIYIYLCMSALSAQMSIHHMHAWCSQESEEGTGSPNEVIGSCETRCGCCKLNPGTLHR